VIYGGVEPRASFDGVDEALRVPGTDLRLFGKPEASPRRMGVALARAGDVETARAMPSSRPKVKPRKA
jgi:phosphoribosylglycinamide formyltransferase 2